MEKLPTGTAIAESPPSPRPLLVDLRGAAAYLCVKVATIRWLIGSGQLAYVRIGHKFCVKISELDRWVSANERREKPKEQSPKDGLSLVQAKRKAR